MATSTPTIYNELAQAVAAESELAGLAPNPDSYSQLQADLASTSRVSRWRWLMLGVAYVATRLQDLFDLHKAEVRDLAIDGHFGTRRWFAAKALVFQYGYVLQFTPLDAYYAVDDPSARIVTHSAVVELGNRVIVKAAKTQGSALAKLDPPERQALEDYFQELRPPVLVSVLTADPDKFRIYGTVVYDAQAILGIVQVNVYTAIRTYLMGLEFGGVLRLTQLKAAMLAANGVVDVNITSAQARTTGPYFNITRIYTSYAGYMAIDAGYNPQVTMQWLAGNI